MKEALVTFFRDVDEHASHTKCSRVLHMIHLGRQPELKIIDSV